MNRFIVVRGLKSSTSSSVTGENRDNLSIMTMKSTEVQTLGALEMSNLYTCTVPQNDRLGYANLLLKKLQTRVSTPIDAGYYY